MCKGRAASPSPVAQCTSASASPWVTQSSLQPVSRTVVQRSLQSAWSEMIRGNSTPLWRARARTRIQPEADTVIGSGNFWAHTSLMALGGQITMLPPRLFRWAGSTLRISPRSIPQAW